MMRKVWLAVVLGIIIGLGIAVAPRAASPQDKTMLQLTGANQPPQPARYESTTQQPDPIQYLLVALLAAIAVATPVFVLSRQHLTR